MRSVGGFSAFSLRDQLVSILHSQIDLAFGYVSRAHRDGGADRGQLKFAKRAYEGAVEIRRKVELEDGDTDDLDRDLDRLLIAVSDATAGPAIERRHTVCRVDAPQSDARFIPMDCPRCGTALNVSYTPAWEFTTQHFRCPNWGCQRVAAILVAGSALKATRRTT